MNEFMVKLFGRGADGLSSLRWVYVWTYLFVVVVVFGAWAFMYCKTNAQADVPIGVAGLAGTIIAIVTGNKYFEKREELKKDAVVPESEKLAPSSSSSGNAPAVGGK